MNERRKSFKENSTGAEKRKPPIGLIRQQAGGMREKSVSRAESNFDKCAVRA